MQRLTTPETIHTLRERLEGAHEDPSQTLDLVVSDSKGAFGSIRFGVQNHFPEDNFFVGETVDGRAVNIMLDPYDGLSINLEDSQNGAP